MYDLVVKGGEVIAPGDGLHGRMDIAVEGGKIAAIAPDIDAESRRTIDVRGAIVAPGLIDLHTHVDFGMRTEGVNARGVDPDLVGVRAGVTTVVDAGTTGPYIFGGFRHYVMDRARTRVLCFLHVGRGGISLEPDVRFEEDVNLDAFATAFARNRDVIVGVKTRLTGPGLKTMGARIAALAKEAARAAGLPVMMHIGDRGYVTGDTTPWEGAARVTRAALKLMERGDIIDHVYTGFPGGVVDPEGGIMPEFEEALSRGCIAGSSSGRNMFHVRTMRIVLDAGYRPGFIATDVNSQNRLDVCFSLAESMSRHMAFGLTTEDVIRLTTSEPAAIIGRQDTLGHLAVGREADLSVLRLLVGRWRFRDRDGESVTGEKAIVPVCAIRAGEVVDLEWGPHPWGWLPESADVEPVVHA